MNKNIYSIETPCYVISEERIIKNLSILKELSTKTGCKILMAQKAFSMYSLYPIISEYLSGTTASGLFEARLGYEEMGKENHIYASAYLEKDFDEILNICDHICFNSFSQWEKYKEKALNSGKSFGLRVNPCFSTQEHSIYDPCANGSRLGITRENFQAEKIDGIEGLHFHTLCEQNSDALIKTLEVVEKNFGEFFHLLKWINFGGGHHITRSDYQIDDLVNCLNTFKSKYNLEIYLEPGEAIAYNAGYLVSSVLDLVKNDINIALLDTSAACHMPDVLEMPYRPPLFQSGYLNEHPYNYRLAGSTCLAGDIIGDYSFDKPLCIGDKLIFEDMAIYTMVKNNTFNGINLPSIAIERQSGNIEIVKSFSYKDFKSRL